MKVLAGYDRGNVIAVVMRVRNTDKTTRELHTIKLNRCSEHILREGGKK